MSNNLEDRKYGYLEKAVTEMESDIVQTSELLTEVCEELKEFEKNIAVSMEKCRREQTMEYNKLVQDLEKRLFEEIREINVNFFNLEKDVFLFKRMASIIGSILLILVPIIINLVIKLIFDR